MTKRNLKCVYTQIDSHSCPCSRVPRLVLKLYIVSGRGNMPSQNRLRELYPFTGFYMSQDLTGSIIYVTETLYSPLPSVPNKSPPVS